MSLFTVWLASIPLSSVQIPISCSNNLANPNVTSLIFDQNNWSDPQKVALIGYNDVTRVSLKLVITWDIGWNFVLFHYHRTLPEW